MKYSVKVIDYETKLVIHSVDCSSEERANKVENGININLNHDMYYTSIEILAGS
jgi:hypothetical protein